MSEDWSKHFRKTTLNLRELVNQTLVSDRWEHALLSLVHTLSLQGYTKQQLYDAFLNEHLRLRMEMREVEEDLIADVVLDGLSGWCSVSNRLLPDEPDAK